MTQRISPSEVAAIFDAEVRDPLEHEALGPRYNVAPTQLLTVVVQREEGRFVELHRWGMVPSWSKSVRQQGARLINARAETVASSPAFRASFAQRRCIVPADAFYEWRRDAGRRQPQPFLIRPRNGQLLAFAGLWAPWREPANGEWLLSAAVVTTAANATVGQLHDRMPVILPAESWGAWLEPMLSNAGLLRSLLLPAPEELLELVPVSPRVNSPHNEGPELVTPYSPAVNAELFPALKARG